MHSKYFENNGLSTLKKLEKLGLSDKAARVYLDLLRRPAPSGSSKIMQATGLHPQYIYDALAELERMGLASHVVVGKRRKFLAAHPSRLEFLAERQRRIAAETAHELSRLTDRNRVQDFELYQGDDAFVAHEFDEVACATEGEEWLIIGGAEDRFLDTVGTRALQEYDAERAKKRIVIRYIGSDTHASLQKRRANFNVRVFPHAGRSIVNTVVRPGSLAFSTYAQPILTYAVRNTEVAESYRHFFEALWAVSKRL